MDTRSDGDCGLQKETEVKPDTREEGKNNEEESIGNTGTNDNESLPIDRGWAWMILAGCFLNTTWVIGYIQSLSLFFVEFLEMFQASTAATSLIIGVIALSASLFSLITMHVLLEFLGIRKTVMMGGTLVTVAIMSASFARNIVFLICTHVLLGIGQSMIQAPGLVMLSKYFKKRRSLATTTASSAISLSSGVFPLLAKYLLDVYGIRGAMFIISGLTMNLWVGAALFRPLEYFKPNKKSQSNDKEETESMIKVNEINDTVSPLSRSLETLDTSYLSLDNNEQFRKRTFSEGSKYKQHSKVKYKTGATISQSEKLAYSSNPDIMDVSVVDIPSDQMDHVNDTVNEKASPILRNLRKILNAFDFSLFKNPIFLLIAAFSHFGVVLRFTKIYLPARVNELGFSQSDAALLLLITGILDFFCRIICGFIADLKFLKVQHIMALGLLITGLSTQLMTFFTTFPLLITYAVLIGIFGSAFQCLMPVVIVEFMGLEYLAKCLGFMALFQGFAAGVTHPIIGAIRDLSGSYVACYHYIGTASFLAAGLLLCEPLVRRYSEKKPLEEGRERMRMSRNTRKQME